MNITNIKGIGEKTAALFDKLNIYDTADLIKHYPRDYEYYEKTISISDISSGVHAINAKCMTNGTIRYVRGMSIVTCRLTDGTGEVTVIYYNMPYVRNALKAGEDHVFRGNFIKKGNAFTLSQPRMYKVEEYDKLAGSYQPLYSTTKGLSSSTIQKYVKKAIETEIQISPTFTEQSPLYDKLPSYIIEKRNLISFSDAVMSIHAPSSFDELIKARKRLVYQEFFDFIFNIEKNRDRKLRINDFKMLEVAQCVRLIEALPFRLTQDQLSVWNDIEQDMSSEARLMRLVQGDVGSGKTIIAILALLMCVCNGYQGAMMAPTEVLARQHYDYISELAGKYNLPIKPVLLTGSVKGKSKKEKLTEIESGEVNVVIGTHALFQEKVEYKDLALVITDEQHRFGVLQRDALRDKSKKQPHVLIMSATPIPRTLAMILYGDLDVSTIHTMPNGRLPIKNCVVDTSFRNKAYEFVVNEVNKNHQVYIICPQVEESDGGDVENVTDYANRLKTILPDNIRIESLHGQMKSSKKDEIMERMSQGHIDVLVSTTVVEVGVNVPNATLMYIENAERFGLAQLHQLRGRVGRSDVQSYCIFMMGQASDKAKERLSILETSNDGFEIANQDMKLRGPGDIFGIRQSGEMSFVLGDVYQDSAEIMAAAEDVKEVIANSI